ncbi:MAG TPA: hypothetical protein VHC22_04270 [Pirellulales bacterium]|nr:hypothetical protein [Pirellulales bacterium]
MGFWQFSNACDFLQPAVDGLRESLWPLSLGFKNARSLFELTEPTNLP